IILPSSIGGYTEIGLICSAEHPQGSVTTSEIVEEEFSSKVISNCSLISVVPLNFQRYELPGTLFVGVNRNGSPIQTAEGILKFDVGEIRSTMIEFEEQLGYPVRLISN